MEILRADVDGDVLSVDVDVDRLHVAADRVTCFEQHDVAGAVEEPGEGNAGHASADDADRTPPARRARDRGHTGSGNNRSQNVAPRDGKRIRHGGGRYQAVQVRATAGIVIDALPGNTRRPIVR